MTNDEWAEIYYHLAAYDSFVSKLSSKFWVIFLFELNFQEIKFKFHILQKPPEQTTDPALEYLFQFNPKLSMVSKRL